MTKARYVEVMHGFLMSAAWQECLLPHYRKLRQQFLDRLVDEDQSMEQVIACRFMVRALQELIETPLAVKAMQEELAAEPGAVMDVLQSEPALP